MGKGRGWGGDGQKVKRWGGGEVERWGGGEVERWGGGEVESTSTSTSIIPQCDLIHYLLPGPLCLAYACYAVATPLNTMCHKG